MAIPHKQLTFGTVFPKSVPPSRQLHLADVSQEKYDEHFALRVLQGIVARGQPSIVLNSPVRDVHPKGKYCSYDLDDSIWTSRLGSQGYRVTEVPDALDLVSIYRDHISGAVLYEDLGPHYVNLALMIAARHSAIPCTPFLARRLGLDVVEDIRDRWANAADAYTWALDNLRTDCHPYLVAVTPDRHFCMMDYLAQHRVFTCDIGNFHSADEGRVFSQVLRTSPPCSPVIGVWDLFYGRYSLDPDMDYERIFIDTVSEHGHFFLVTHDCSNMSLHSGLPAPPLPARIPPAPQAVEVGKTYLCFIFSEGDNVTFQTRNRPTIWQDPARGTVPLGWSIAPLMTELFPDVVAYYEESRTANDEWVIATSGIGYCMPSRLGAKLDENDRAAAKDRFFALTEQASAMTGVDSVWILDHRETGGPSRTDTEYVADPDTIASLIDGCPSVRYVFCDYPDFFDRRLFTPKQYVKSGVPVMHARTGMGSSLPLVEQIRGLAGEPGETPFVFVFVSGWAESPSSIKKCVDELGGSFVALGPRQFAETYLAWENAGSDRSARAPSARAPSA